ncbi:hypothetical protein [Psychrosphaera algicola]|uniref:HBM domain-containing protein n=1 Tax=Psychrosphaera algicola TaxID=3023714 RepID=A0ABT5FD39_9GAMM|nr:hypothetical protein [Psychrosphaera sp. G1-22]MDC2889455.1 hypothetical protein [Psychrosphaera sp. G1-22]
MNLLTNLTIRARLQVNAVVIALALLTLFALMLINLTKMNDLGQALVKVESLNSQVLMLRRNEKDFLARKELKYVDLFTKNSALLSKQIAELGVMTSDLGIKASELDTFAQISELYTKQFVEVSQFQQKVGLDSKDGLYGELRNAVHDVEDILNSNQTHRLLVDMLQLRRTEKDFMLRRDAKYLAVFDEQMTHFYKDIDNADLTGDTATRIKASLDIYKEKFLNLAKAEKAIGLNAQSGLLGQLRGTITQTEDSLSAIKSKLETSLEQAISTATITAIIVFIGAMIFVMVVVYYTSQSIISPILAVRNAISHIRTKKILPYLLKQKVKTNWLS